MSSVSRAATRTGETPEGIERAQLLQGPGFRMLALACLFGSALGVPVVATDAPGLRDAVRPGETGRLVADGDAAAFTERLRVAIGALLADEEELGRLASGAHRWAQRFDWERSADRMEEAVRAAVAAG